jgi:hypothetical protein
VSGEVPRKEPSHPIPFGLDRSRSSFVCPRSPPSAEASGGFPYRSALMPKHRPRSGLVTRQGQSLGGWPVWLPSKAEALPVGRFGSPSGPKPWRFTVRQFREARKPLVPPGCSTKHATLANAWGKPAASANAAASSAALAFRFLHPPEGEIRPPGLCRGLSKPKVPSVLATHPWSHENRFAQS